MLAGCVVITGGPSAALELETNAPPSNDSPRDSLENKERQFIAGDGWLVWRLEIKNNGLALSAKRRPTQSKLFCRAYYSSPSKLIRRMGQPFSSIKSPNCHIRFLGAAVWRVPASLTVG